MENNLVDFAKENPGVVVYVKPRRHRTPVMVAEYLNGDGHWVNCRNNSMEEIHKWLNLLRSQNGNSSAIRWRKLWHTDMPSIQGPWTPFTHKHPENNLAKFPSESSSVPIDKPVTASEQLLKMFKEQSLEDKLEK